MNFKEFLNKKESELKETMTSTSCVANFQRIAIPMVTRMYPPEDEFFKRLRNKKKTEFTLVK